MRDRKNRCGRLILLIIMIFSLTACTGTAGPGTQGASAPGTPEQTKTALPASSEEKSTKSADPGQKEPNWDAITFQPVEYQLGTWIMGEPNYLDPNGELVTTPAFPVRDVFTDEVRYYTVNCTHIASKIGWRMGDRFFVMLFDAQGNLMEKRLEGSVDGAIGDLLIRTYMGAGEDAFGLWDPSQDRVVADNIQRLQRMDVDTALVIDKDGNIRGTLDRETLTITERTFETPLNFEMMIHGLIFARSSAAGEGPSLVVLDETLEQRYKSGEEGYCESETVFDLGEDGKFFCVNDWDGGRIVRMIGDETRIVYENKLGAASSLSLLDCDHDRMVIREQGDFFLCDLEGKRLTDTYESMGTLKTADGSIRYGASRGQTIFILDADGNVQDMKVIDRLQEVYYPGGAIRYVMKAAKGSGSSNWGTGFLSGLMDASFCDIIPAGHIQNIGAYEIGDGPDLYWLVSREEKSGYQIDIYNSAMEPIALGVTKVGTSTEQGIAIQKGFYQGVIDFDGNWISRHSIYETEWRD